MTLLPSVRIQVGGSPWIHQQLSGLRLRTRCYIPIIQQAHRDMADHIRTTIIGLVEVVRDNPRMVLVMRGGGGIANDVLPTSLFSCPWVVLTKHSRVAVTCPGCGTTHAGLWNPLLSDQLKVEKIYTN